MEQWSLKGTLNFFTVTGKAGILVDISYVEAASGIPGLLLCLSHEKSVEAIEMLGGRRRWKIGTEQLGQEMNPVSLCTDHDNNVYVADYDEQKLHVFSAEDSIVSRRINLLQYGIVYPECVRISKDFMYISHTDITDIYKYQTSKLAIKENFWNII